MQVETFEKACESRGYDANTVLPDVSNFPKNHQAAITAFAMLVIIAEAINEGHQFNWNDYNEKKWYPWFDLETDEDANPSGFRFIAAHYVYALSGTAGGSRLCFRTQADAKYAGTMFLDLYRDIMVVQG